MNEPSSFAPSSSSLSLSVNSIINCQVCGRIAHGNHFGAVTCRACAAFFRRFGILNNCRPCKYNNKCDFLPKKCWFPCKRCRLQRCWDIGMTNNNFQFQRDSFHRKNLKMADELNQKSLVFKKQIPETIGTFLGRKSLIIFSASNHEDGLLCYVDMRDLVRKAGEILEKGSPSPAYNSSSLEKLALGIQQFHSCSNKTIKKFGKEEMLGSWECDMLKVAKWLTYFDEFQNLGSIMKLEIVKGIWKVWARLEKLALTARRRNSEDVGTSGLVLGDLTIMEVDLSWCSRYTVEQLKFFDSADSLSQSESLVQLMIDLQPSDVELSYMLCQLCFYQVGKQYQGEILEATDRFQEILSDSLHDYYLNSRKDGYYSSRLASMMKINNLIGKCIYQDRVKTELMLVFDVFYMRTSNPELFAIG